MPVTDLPDEILLLPLDTPASQIITRIEDSYDDEIDDTFWKLRCEHDFSQKAINAHRVNGSWKETYQQLWIATTEEYKLLKAGKTNLSWLSSNLRLSTVAISGNTALLHFMLKLNPLALQDIFNLKSWDVIGEELLWQDRQKQGCQTFLYYTEHHVCLLDFISLHQQQRILDMLYLQALEEEPANSLFWAIACNQSEEIIAQILHENKGSFTHSLLVFDENLKIQLFELAAALGHVKLFKFLLAQHKEKSFELIKEAFTIAAQRNQTEILEHLAPYCVNFPKQEMPLYIYLVEVAAFHKDNEILKILLSQIVSLEIVQSIFKTMLKGQYYPALVMLSEKYPQVVRDPVFLHSMLFEAVETKSCLILQFLFDLGVDLLELDSKYRGQLESSLWSNYPARMMFKCEMKIQEAVRSVKNSNWDFGSVGANYLANTVSRFFQSDPSELLNHAKTVSPMYFSHRMNLLLNSETIEYKVKQKLDKAMRKAPAIEIVIQP